MFTKKSIFKLFICFAAVLSAGPFFLCRPVQADATGCLGADVYLRDADSEKLIQGEQLYADLKAVVYENGRQSASLSTLVSGKGYARFVIGMDESYSFNLGYKLKLGNRYAFELMIPDGYTLDRIVLNKTYSGKPLPKAFKVRENQVTFTYDKEIKKQLDTPGEGGGFGAFYYLRKGSGNGGQAATKINLPKTRYKLAAGAKSFNLKAKVVNGTALTYQSDRPSVISVSKKGKITVKKPGTAVVTIKSKPSAKYTGQTVKVNFTVTPKKPASVKAASPKKKTVRVTWRSVPSASGYTIRYSDRKDMKNYLTVPCPGGRTTSKIFNNLASGRYVYVRVQAYSTDGSTAIHGSWSKTAGVRIK